MAAGEINTDHCSFYRILISSTGYRSICPAIVVQAALVSRAACTTMARHIEG